MLSVHIVTEYDIFLTQKVYIILQPFRDGRVNETKCPGVDETVENVSSRINARIQLCYSILLHDGFRIAVLLSFYIVRCYLLLGECMRYLYMI